MAEVIKTKYMDKATRGYSEYVARDLNALQTISPKEGDRAILLDGSLYICVDNGTWDITGGTKETDILIITAGYKTGGERGYTIDKTYAEIYSAAQAGKTLIMVDPVALSANGLPIILTPYSFNSDGSGTFVTIAKGDDMGGSKDYRYSITVYPDNTVIPRWEDLSQELDHTVTFKVDGQPYAIVSVKDGQSVSAPSPNPTSENGAFGGWQIEGKSVTFPYLPTNDVEMEAYFSALINLVYDKYGLSKETYPYVAVVYSSTSGSWMVQIGKRYTVGSETVTIYDLMYNYAEISTFNDFDNVAGAVSFAMENIPTLRSDDYRGFSLVNANQYVYTNIPFDNLTVAGHFYSL